MNHEVQTLFRHKTRPGSAAGARVALILSAFLLLTAFGATAAAAPPTDINLPKALPLVQQGTAATIGNTALRCAAKPDVVEKSNPPMCSSRPDANESGLAVYAS